MSEDLIIVGASGFGKEVAWLVESINGRGERWRLRGFLDDRLEPGAQCLGYPVLGPVALAGAEPDWGSAVVAIGDPRVRLRVTRQFLATGVRLPALIHPSVELHPSNRVGEGTVICAGSTITVEVVIGAHVHLNLHCTVGHGAVLEDYCTLSPGVHVSGDVHLERGVFLGTGAQTIQGVRVAEGAVVGAGATVTRDLPTCVVAVGSPARAVKGVPPFA